MPFQVETLIENTNSNKPHMHSHIHPPKLKITVDKRVVHSSSLISNNTVASSPGHSQEGLIFTEHLSIIMNHPSASMYGHYLPAALYASDLKASTSVSNSARR